MTICFVLCNSIADKTVGNARSQKSREIAQVMMAQHFVSFFQCLEKRIEMKHSKKPMQWRRPTTMTRKYDCFAFVCLRFIFSVFFSL
jgi:hypothetical protein